MKSKPVRQAPQSVQKDRVHQVCEGLRWPVLAVVLAAPLDLSNPALAMRALAPSMAMCLVLQVGQTKILVILFIEIVSQLDTQST